MPDIQTVLPARSEGGSYNVSAPGDFVFVKYTDAPVKLVIDNTEPVTVTTGDKRRPSRRFNSFLLENPHERPIAVVLYVGEGDFDSQIIQGEVSIVPGVRGADGAWRDDTRHDLDAFIEPVSDTGRIYPAFESIYSTNFVAGPGSSRRLMGAPGSLMLLTRESTSHTRYQRYDSRCRHLATSIGANVTWVGSLPSAGINNIGTEDVAFVRGRAVALCGGSSVGSGSKCVVLSPGPNPQIIHDFGWPAQTGNFGASICEGAGGGIVVLMRNRRVFVGGPNGTVHQLQIPTGAARIRYDSSERAYYIATEGVRTLFKFNERFQLVAEYTDIPTGIFSGMRAAGFAVAGDVLWCVGTGGASGGDTLRAVPLREISEPLIIAARRGSRACRDMHDAIWRVDDLPLSEAQVDGELIGDRLLVTGEVLRALLTAITGRTVGEKYLDHVFAASWVQDGKVISKVTGGRSFAAAGVADNFALMLPAEVRITVDDGLPLGDLSTTL